MIRKFCLVLCGIALTWFCAATGLFFLSGFRCTLRTPRLAVARARVLEIEHAATQYSIEFDRCPRGDDDLIAAHLISPVSLTDPWKTVIAFSCSDQDVKVESAGPDGIFGTWDDVKNEH